MGCSGSTLKQNISSSNVVDATKSVKKDELKTNLNNNATKLSQKTSLSPSALHQDNNATTKPNTVEIVLDKEEDATESKVNETEIDDAVKSTHDAVLERNDSPSHLGGQEGNENVMDEAKAMESLHSRDGVPTANAIYSTTGTLNEPDNGMQLEENAGTAQAALLMTETTTSDHTQEKETDVSGEQQNEELKHCNCVNSNTTTGEQALNTTLTTDEQSNDASSNDITTEKELEENTKTLRTLPTDSSTRSLDISDVVDEMVQVTVEEGLADEYQWWDFNGAYYFNPNTGKKCESLDSNVLENTKLLHLDSDKSNTLTWISIPSVDEKEMTLYVNTESGKVLHEAPESYVAPQKNDIAYDVAKQFATGAYANSIRKQHVKASELPPSHEQRPKSVHDLRNMFQSGAAFSSTNTMSRKSEPVMPRIRSGSISEKIKQLRQSGVDGATPIAPQLAKVVDEVLSSKSIESVKARRASFTAACNPAKQQLEKERIHEVDEIVSKRRKSSKQMTDYWNTVEEINRSVVNRKDF